MPGPVSDSYDPEFSTGENADIVRKAIADVEKIFTKRLGPELKYIVHVAMEKNKGKVGMPLTYRQMRIIRFCLRRALEDI